MSAQHISLQHKQVNPTKLILVIEDDEANAEMLHLAITQEVPCLVHCINNGCDALRVAQEIKPDLLILDYVLPSMNGIQLYQHIQTIPELSTIPVLMMSAFPKRHEVESLHLPFLEKPFELDTLLTMVHHLLPA